MIWKVYYNQNNWVDYAFGASVLLLCVQDGYVTFVSEVISECKEQRLPAGIVAASEACV